MDKSRQFSVGMAVFNDFDGVYFTTQDLLVHHGDYIAEIIVVDNNSSERIKRYCNTVPKIRYVDFPQPKGTAAPREHIFSVAQSDRVVVIDSHVILHPGAMAALDAGVTSDDLYHGPLIYDWGDICATHMDDVWRGQMWGIWGVARQEIGNPGAPIFSVIDGKAVELMTGKVLDIKVTVGMEGYEVPKRPFTIPAHGMGLWACKRDSWLHFNKDFREFGGEEWYIHEKYRKAGRRVVCLPEVKWRHRFSDLTQHKIEYPLTLRAKINNYIIGLKELGLPTDRLRQEFVGNNLIPAQEFDAMACNCGAKVTTAMKVPSSFPSTGVVVDFSGSDWPNATEVIRPPESPGNTEVIKCDILCLGNYPAALGKWADAAPRIIVEGGLPQVTPFLSIKPQYTLITSVGGWCYMSSLAEDKGAIPGVLDMMKNGFMALGRAAKSAVAARSLPLVDEGTHEQRLNQCYTCNKRTNSQCSLCGCFVDQKTWVASEKCPDTPPKWKEVV